jgi:hypothetical protein
MCGICVMIPGIRARQPRDGQMNCGNQSAHISLIHRRFTALASRDPCAVHLKMFKIEATKNREIHAYPLDKRQAISVSYLSRHVARPGRTPGRSRLRAVAHQDALAVGPVLRIELALALIELANLRAPAHRMPISILFSVILTVRHYEVSLRECALTNLVHRPRLPNGFPVFGGPSWQRSLPVIALPIPLLAPT